MNRPGLSGLLGAMGQGGMAPAPASPRDVGLLNMIAARGDPQQAVAAQPPLQDAPDPILARFHSMARRAGFDMNRLRPNEVLPALRAIRDDPEFGGDMDGEFLDGIAKEMGVTSRELFDVPPAQMMGPKGPSGLPRPLPRR